MNLTQTDLAERLGTTAATVSRLETQGIKISADWLVPLADILHVQISDLIDEPSPERIELLGKIDPNGIISSEPNATQSGFKLRFPAAQPIAARLTHDIGQFRAGELLIADKFHEKQVHQGFERDCFVGAQDGTILLSRLLRGPRGGKRYCIAPLHSKGSVKYVDQISWCAPIIMAVRYF
jgi:transcriptional regulator with XRE-family HTH domain